MAKGKVVQVIGTVVDVEFPPDALPAIYNGIEIALDSDKIVLETQHHIGNNWVRAVALSPTEGLRRGTEAIDMGSPITVPVGRATLGRLFNVFGEPLDGLHTEAQKDLRMESGSRRCFCRAPPLPPGYKFTLARKKGP